MLLTVTISGMAASVAIAFVFKVLAGWRCSALSSHYAHVVCDRNRSEALLHTRARERAQRILANLIYCQNQASLALTLYRSHNCAKEGRQQTSANESNSMRGRCNRDTLQALEVWPVSLGFRAATRLASWLESSVTYVTLISWKAVVTDTQVAVTVDALRARLKQAAAHSFDRALQLWHGDATGAILKCIVGLCHAYVLNLLWATDVKKMQGVLLEVSECLHNRSEDQRLASLAHLIMFLWKAYAVDHVHADGVTARRWQHKAAKHWESAENAALVRISLSLWWVVAQGHHPAECLPCYIPQSSSVDTLGVDLAGASFSAWRLVCLLRRQAGQSWLLRRGARVVSRTLEWRKAIEVLRLCEVALESWRWHCMRARCEREVRLLVDEKDTMHRELVHLRHGRDRCKQNAFAIIERSMSAAVLAQTLEGGSGSTSMTLSELLPV